MTEMYDDVIDSIISPFRGNADIEKLFEIALKPFEEIKDAIDYIKANLNIDDAEDVWLDIIGVHLGLERPIKEQDPNTMFTLKEEGEADDPDKGFYLAGPPETGGYMNTEEGLDNVLDPTLKETDTNYRRLLKAKAAALTATGTIRDLYIYLLDGFQCRSEIREGDCEAVVTPYHWLSQRERYHTQKYGPRVAGVRVVFDAWPPYEE